MADTKTSRTPARAGRSTAPRYGRSTTSSQGRFARASSASRTQGLRRRRQPEPSGLKKVLGSLIPAATAKKAAPSSKKGKAGGLALVAAAAGMALKNRDKLSQMRQKGTGSTAGSPTSMDTANNSPMPPSTPAI
jgi:hypothetical protein